MLNVTREMKGTTLVLRLKGSIDESTPLEQAFGAPAPVIEVNCREITSINSSGVKAWIRYFQAAAKGGSRFSFHECSQSIVDQINFIMNFTCGGKVESIFLPFCCESCNTPALALFKCDDLRAAQLQVTPPACVKCGAATSFDEIPEEYLGFLTR